MIRVTFPHDTLCRAQASGYWLLINNSLYDLTWSTLGNNKLVIMYTYKDQDLITNLITNLTEP